MTTKDVEVTRGEAGEIVAAAVHGVPLKPGGVVQFAGWNGRDRGWLLIKEFLESEAYGPSVGGSQYSSKLSAETALSRDAETRQRAARHYMGFRAIPLALIARAKLLRTAPVAKKRRRKKVTK